MMPAIRFPDPFKALVAEFITMSARHLTGFRREGVAKVLSTTIKMPCLCAGAASALKSATALGGC
jgi:hypothetical protein